MRKLIIFIAAVAMALSADLFLIAEEVYFDNDAVLEATKDVNLEVEDTSDAVESESASDEEAVSEELSQDQAGQEESDVGNVDKTRGLTSGSGSVDMSRLITLDLRNMDVVDALKYIALRSGMNIVTSKQVTGRVTFQLKDVPLKDIFDITLLSNDLAYEKIGDIYYVMSDKEYESRYGEKFSDIREVKVFRLKYAIPDKAFSLLDTMKSKVGRILVDQETGTVLLVDTPDKLKEMAEALMTLEQKGEVVVFNLQYANAADVEAQLKSRIDDKNVGLVKADERSNQVIVQTLTDRMDDVEKIIKALDRKTKEVLIDTRIIKVKISDDLNIGMQWEGMLERMSDSGMKFFGNHPLYPIYREGKSYIDQYTEVATEDANLPAGSKTTGLENLYFGQVKNEYSYEAMLNLLQTLGDTRLISNPRLAVVNNQEAKIHVGRREAYITTTTTTGTTTTTTAEEVTFLDIGIQLSVTPTINDDGYVTLKIKPEISSVVDNLETPSGNIIPIVDTSLAETTVMVKDGSTIVIGGLRREEEVNTIEQVPFLGSIPFIGTLLFSHRIKEKEHTELLVIITPHIMGGDVLVTGEIKPGDQDMKPYSEYGVFERAEEKKGNLQLKSYIDEPYSRDLNL